MPTATHSRTDFAQTKGQPELATLRSLETLHNAGVLEDGMVSPEQKYWAD